jgi:signal transduction histidine kinase
MGTALFIGVQPAEVLAERVGELGDLAVEAFPGTDDALARVVQASGAVDAVIIGPGEDNAVAVAQRVYKLDRDVSILILASAERLDALKSSLSFAPFIGRHARYGPLAPHDHVREQLMQSVADTRARRQHRRTLRALSARLASSSVPAARAASVFDRLLELAPVGIVALDPAGKIEVANQAAQRMLGDGLRGPGADFGKSLHLDEAQVDSLLREALSSGLPQTARLERSLQGEQAMFDATAVRLDEGGLLVIVHDVTERVRGERQRDELVARLEAALRMRDDFLSVASHELRTPLTSMMGWLTLVRTGRLTPEKSARALETIERNAKAQAQLIDDLLDVSRIVTGKVRLEVTSVSIEDVVRQAIESVSPAAEAKGIRLQVLIDPHVGVVMGDAHRLQQVVWNLLTNAVKFTPKDGKVTVTLRRVGSSAEILVRDDGIGIPPEALAVIFERFRQADMATNRSYGGLGLGLSIVKHFVEMHGGTVQAQSEGKGQGACFTVRLPLSASSVAGDLPRGGDEKEPDFHCPPGLVGLSVLVVEDEPSVRDLLVTLLTSCGMKVTGVGSAQEALIELERQVPHILVSDVGMPVMDGYELIRRVRALPADKGGKVPALAITAYARPEDRFSALRAGFQMHLAKPVRPDELLLVLARLTDRM